MSVGDEYETTLGLNASADFTRFIEKDFAFYTRQYERLRQAADALSPGLECVHYNAQNNFTLQYPVLLAPLRVSDSDKEILRKLRITATYIDILITRRIWNSRAIDYSTMQYAMFLVMREIRGKTAPEVAALLSKRLEGETETFASTDRFRLNAMNGRQIHRLLARITDYVETSSGLSSHYAEYIQRKGKNGYEIEHVWANHPELHEDEFTQQADFQEYRNRVGGLLLLPKSINASCGDLPYAEKRAHYVKENLLAQSLHELAYERNPGFLRLAKEKTLPFRAHAEFRKADLDARQQLYRSLADDLWSPTRLNRELASDTGAA
jgi:hypothetical protein